MQRMRTYMLFFVLATLITAGAVGIITSTPQKALAATTISGLHVSGNHILNSSGQIFRPLGVDRSGTEYMCDSSTSTTVLDGPSDATSVAAMASWGINTVRVPINEDCWLGINGFPAGNYNVSQYQQAVVNYVNLLNSYNLAVIIDLHWNAPGSQQATGQKPMPDADHAPALWNSLASKFKSNSSVIFDLYNEPYTGNWSCWLNGSSSASASPCNDVPFAVAGMQTLVNTVRATGATNVLMLGGLAWSNDMSQWLQHEPTDPLHGLAVSFHLYNFNACSNTNCWNSQVAPVAAQVPIITGEMGENDCSHGFIDAAMNWFDQHGVGYVGWSWNTASCSAFPALITDYNGSPTGFGIGLKNHLLALVGSGNTPTPTPTTGTTPTPPPTHTPTPTSTPGSSACQIHYTVQNQWPGGFTAAITIANTGTSAINGWTLQFSFATGQTITNSWSGTYTQQGAQVTVKDQGYNSSIQVNQSVAIGFNANWNGSNPAPSSFKLNGATCSIA